MKYAIWNNKGGVGKTFLSFMLAAEYARLNPAKNVVVIDMCPQANISEILLGGNGKGSEQLDKFLTGDDRRTIGGYFDKRLSRPDDKTGTEVDYLQQVRLFAPDLPSNLWLIAGDPSLELQVQSINQIASADLPENRWKNVHSWVSDLEDAMTTRFNREVIFFIDCNPSFATYTAQAILGSNRIIIPCTADGSSARAIDNVAKLVYGVDTPKGYAKTNFYQRAKDNQLALPSIHAVILNRCTINKNKPASAFSAMYQRIKDRVNDLQSKKREIFTPKIQIFQEMPDAHTVSIVASYYAKTLDQITPGNYYLGDEKGKKTMINPDPLERYKRHLAEIVEIL